MLFGKPEDSNSLNLEKKTNFSMHVRSGFKICIARVHITDFSKSKGKQGVCVAFFFMQRTTEWY